MRLFILSSAFVAFSLGSAGLAKAQIRDNESSVSFLAVHCALSGGGNADNYREYSTNLAKTVALLDTAQQERVFGFVPQPGAIASIPNALKGTQGGLAGQGLGAQIEGTNDVVSLEAGANNSAGLGGAAAQEAPEEQGVFEEFVGSVNGFFNGNSGSDVSAPIIGGTAPVEETESAEATVAESETENWIDQLVGFLGSIGWDKTADFVDTTVGEAKAAGIIDENGVFNRDANGNVVDSNGEEVFGSSAWEKKSNEDGNSGLGNSGGYDADNLGKGNENNDVANAQAN